MKTSRSFPVNMSYVPLVLFAAVLAVTISYRHMPSKTVPVFYDDTTVIVRNIDNISVKTVAASDTSAKASVNTAVPAQPSAILPVLPPKVIYRIMPEYPASVLAKGIEGSSILAVYVGTTGLPEKIEIKMSSGAEELDASAIKALMQWRFEPSRRGAQAIESWFQIPVVFKLK
jgi:TonB family protein